MSNEQWPTSLPQLTAPAAARPLWEYRSTLKAFFRQPECTSFYRENFVLIATIKEGCLKRKGRQSGQNEDFGLLL